MACVRPFLHPEARQANFSPTVRAQPIVCSALLQSYFFVPDAERGKGFALS